MSKANFGIVFLIYKTKIPSSFSVIYPVVVGLDLDFALRTQLNLNGGIVGLVFSYLLENLGLIQWATRQSAELENIMVASERIMEYSNLQSEAPEITDVRPPSGWPSRGEILFKDMSLKYPKQDSQALSKINLKILPGEKVGIVGRTGAGKSSLIQALFRLVEPTPAGSIQIDGISLSDLGLRDLRSSISIIPQDSFCFKGTLRVNLDPFGSYSDDQIWRALAASEL
jgi:ABC-type multidrug transport system fused ATPase/permease subunit